MRDRRGVGFIPVVVLWIASLLFVYSSLIFHDQGRPIMGNLIMAVSMLMTTLAGAFLGARFKAIEDDRREMRAVLRGETRNHRIFLQELATISQSVKHANQLKKEGEEVQGTILLHEAEKKLDNLRIDRPSSALFAENEYHEQIDSTMSLVYTCCDQLSRNDHSTLELDAAISDASRILNEYENT